MAGRVDKLIGDVDFRLTAIERVQAEALARVEEAQATNLASGQAQPSTVQPATFGQAPAEPPPAGQSGTLGTVSLNALSPEDGADAVSAAPTTPALRSAPRSSSTNTPSACCASRSTARPSVP